MTDWEYLERKQQIEDYGQMLTDEERDDMYRQLNESYDDDEDRYGR